MVQISIQKLSLRNFKGIKDLTLTLGGLDAVVYGDNATGKTTIYDAFLWLLFGKDSQGRADFDIKTLDKAGEALHGLENAVEAELIVSGKTLALKKVYQEKWTKKRGQAKQEFTGHTTDHFIDGVPVSKGAYTDKINELIDEETFKLLTNPKQFNEQLHWQKRREILLAVCGDVSDVEVIASDKELAALPKILGNRSLEDHRKVIAKERQRINGELEKLPVRIDEVTQGMPDTSEINAAQIRKDIDAFKAKKAEHEAEISRLKNGGQAAELNKRLAEVQANFRHRGNAYQAEMDKRIRAEREKLEEIDSQIDELLRQARKAEQEKEVAASRIEALDKQIQAKRDEWHQFNAETFQADHTCPTCGQQIPEDRLAESEQQFNAAKAKMLKDIQQNGKKLAQEREACQAQIKTLAETIAQAQETIKELSKQRLPITAEIERIQSETWETTEESQLLIEEENGIKHDLARVQSGDNADAIAELEKQIAYCDEQIGALQRSLAKLDQKDRAEKRITELKEEEKRLAAEFERLESELYLTEQFTRAKVNLLEEKINNKFTLARFKLFNQQVNGGIEETCTTVCNGVPYPSMNNAARINVGLDIIKTLSDHYGFSAPIFVDNAESVVELTQTDSQMIALVVSAKHKTLTVSTVETKKSQAA